MVGIDDISDIIGVKILKSKHNILLNFRTNFYIKLYLAQCFRVGKICSSHAKKIKECKEVKNTVCTCQDPYSSWEKIQVKYGRE